MSTRVYSNSKLIFVIVNQRTNCLRGDMYATKDIGWCLCKANQNVLETSGNIEEIIWKLEKHFSWLVSSEDAFQLVVQNV